MADFVQIADKMQELEFLRNEVASLKEKLEHASQFEQKYYEASEEVSRLRERLESRSTPMRTSAGVMHPDGRFPMQLRTPKDSPGPGRETKKMEQDESVVVKREISPITLKPFEERHAVQLKKEKCEDCDTPAAALIVKEGNCEVTDVDNTHEALEDFRVHEGELLDGSMSSSGNCKAPRGQPSRRVEHAAVSIKKEPSVIFISSDDEPAPMTRPRRSTIDVVKTEDRDASFVVKRRGKATRESTVQIKVEEKPDIFSDEVAFAPIQGVLDSYPRVKLLPAQLKNLPVPRELVSYAWGGGTQVVCATTGQEKRQENEKAKRLVVEEYVGLSRVWNPRLPKNPGDHGVAYSVLTVSEPQPLFVREGAWQWRYMGHYTFGECPTEFNGELCPTEFNGEPWDRLPQKTKNVWLNGFVKASWGNHVRVIIHLRRQLGRAPTKEEIAEHGDNSCAVTEDESIGICLARFHYYSDQHYDSLVNREGESKYLNLLDKMKNPKSHNRESKVAGGKKRNTTDSQRTAAPKRTKRNHESDDKVGENDDDYVPKTVMEAGGANPGSAPRRSARHQPANRKRQH